MHEFPLNTPRKLGSTVTESLAELRTALTSNVTAPFEVPSLHFLRGVWVADFCVIWR